jgi:hypothetical protein
MELDVEIPRRNARLKVKASLSSDQHARQHKDIIAWGGVGKNASPGSAVD